MLAIIFVVHHKFIKFEKAFHLIKVILGHVRMKETVWWAIITSGRGDLCVSEGERERETLRCGACGKHVIKTVEMGEMHGTIINVRTVFLTSFSIVRSCSLNNRLLGRDFFTLPFYFPYLSSTCVPPRHPPSPFKWQYRRITKREVSQRPNHHCVTSFSNR